jgi:hypothetical protein
MPSLSFLADVLIRLRGDKKGVAEITGSLDDLGSRLRLTGRDLMRLGSEIEKFMGFALGSIFKILAASEEWNVAMEDLNLAVGDIGDALAIGLVPIIDALLPLLEGIADLIEKNQWIVWLVVVILLVAAIGKLYGWMLQMKGMFSMMIGLVIKSKTNMLSWSTSIRAGIIAWKDLVTGSKSTISYLEKKQGSILKTGENLEYTGEAALTTSEGMDKVGKSSKGLKKGGSAAKGMMLPLAGIMMLGGAFIALLMASEPIMDLVSDLLDALGDAFAVIADAIAPVIEAIGNWVEENPLLAAEIIAAIAAIVIFLSVGGFLKDTLGGIVGVLGKASGGMSDIQKTIKPVTGQILELAGAIGILALSLAAAIWLLSQTRFTVPELIALLWNLVAVVNILGATFIGLAIASSLAVGAGALASLAPVLYPLAGLLIAVGIAALLVGLAFLAAGAGINLACQGLVLLVNSIPELLALVPLLIGIGAGFMLLGLYALGAMVPIFGLAIALGALAMAIIALVGALALLNAMGLGTVAGAIGQGIASAMMPHMLAGGIIKEAGVVYVHPGEEVVPAKVASGKGGSGMGGGVTININAPIGSREIADYVIEEVKKSISSDLRRRQ